MTPAEFRALCVLSVLIITTGAARWLRPHIIYPSEFKYADIDAQFDSLVAAYEYDELDSIVQPPDPWRSYHLADTTKPKKNSGLVDLNTADAEALMTLPRVGPKMAAAIIEYRRLVGRIEYPEELLNVRGIGEKTLEQLIPLVEVDSVDAKAPP